MMNNVIGQGSFRGVPFLIVEESERAGGHRVIKHDYPLRDVGRVQNMGRKTEEITISIILNGDDVLAQRDTLVEALKQSAAGELEHPNFTTQLVHVIEWRERISTRAQRLVSFTITYVAADIDDDSPISTRNGEIDLQSALDGLTNGVVNDVISYYDKAAIAVSQVSETLNFASSIANNITKAIRGITSSTGLSSLLSSSLAFKASVNNLLDAPDKVMRELGDLLGAIREVKGSNATLAFTSINVANNLLSSPNSHTRILKTAIDTLVQGNQTVVTLNDAKSAVKAQGGTAAAMVDNQGMYAQTASSIVTLGDCEQAAIKQGHALQESRIKASDLYWYDTAKHIRAVRQVFIAQMALVSIQLPNTLKVIPAVSEPASVTLYRASGNSAYIKRFVRRNAIKHPSFAVGGNEYEVINETQH